MSQFGEGKFGEGEGIESKDLGEASGEQRISNRAKESGAQTAPELKSREDKALEIAEKYSTRRKADPGREGKLRDELISDPEGLEVLLENQDALKEGNFAPVVDTLFTPEMQADAAIAKAARKSGSGADASTTSVEQPGEQRTAQPGETASQKSSEKPQLDEPTKAEVQTIVTELKTLLQTAKTVEESNPDLAVVKLGSSEAATLAQQTVALEYASEAGDPQRVAQIASQLRESTLPYVQHEILTITQQVGAENLATAPQVTEQARAAVKVSKSIDKLAAGRPGSVSGKDLPLAA